MQQDEQSAAVTQVRSAAKHLATRLIRLSGGIENIIDCTHCTTRLRLRLNHIDLVNEESLKEMKEVQGILVIAGQLQIILGPAVVSKVTRQVNRMLQEEASQTDRHSEELYVVRSPKDKKNGPLTQLLGAVQFFSDIVIPIIPLFVGAGLLLGLLGFMGSFGLNNPDNIWFRMLSLFAGSAFQLMAVLFGYHTAKRFGGTPWLGAAMGIMMTHPSLMTMQEKGAILQSAQALISTPQLGYQGAVVPTILSALLLTFIERKLRRFLPSFGSALIVPLMSVAMAGSLAVLIIEPTVFRLGGVLGRILEEMFATGGLWFGLLLGGIYSSIVITGLHHGIQAVEAGLITNPEIGVNFLLPIWSMANLAQAGAGLAVYVRTQDKAFKKIALNASITALFGITEPVTYGVNLKLGRPFVGAALGGAVGGAYVAFHKVVSNSLGLTGIPMTVFVIQPGLMNFIHYIVGSLLAMATAFITTGLFLGAKRTYSPKGLTKQLRIRSGTGEKHDED
ncbi:PTS transporter subunit EIIC [Paenibacillus sp. CAA11]|uniref:PTS transporter subunit EIIC n=1 Tax=Paenibacillus sp. CAA11 TaxID=1532905 RepID=UPI00131F402A|nr:PTS transporter subunit EIIC [Paenibacillus sp. CAA11]